MLFVPLVFLLLLAHFDGNHRPVIMWPGAADELGERGADRCDDFLRRFFMIHAHDLSEPL